MVDIMRKPAQSLRYWKALRSLMDALRADSGLESEFLADPGKVLKDRKLDIEVPEDPVTGTPRRSLGEILDSMTIEERRAALSALGVVSTLPPALDRGRAAVAVPIANVNVAANHNAAANSSTAANAAAVANALATANTTGVPYNRFDVIRPGLAAKVELRPGAIQASAAKRLDVLHLSEERRKALFKRALLDSNSLVKTESRSGGVELRVGRYAYKGDIYEIKGEVSPEKIRIISVKLVR